jgi:nuclear GTP-binding protein
MDACMVRLEHVQQQHYPSSLSATMAPNKNNKSSKNRSSTSSGSMSLKKVKGENFYRNAKAVARLKMLKGGKPLRDKDGKIIQAAEFQKGEEETKPGRVQPDKRWFGV